MVDFAQSNTYTGKNEPIQPRQSSVKGPSYQEEALGDQRKRDREAIYQRNYENATKATDLKIDDLDIAKLGAQDHLGTLMEDYNKSRAEIMTRSKSGAISVEDTDVLKQKELAIYAEYKNALTSQKNYEGVMTQARQFVDTGDVDMEKLQPAVEAFTQKGEPFTLTAVPLKPIDVNLAITDTSKKVSGDRTPMENVTITNADGTVRKGTARIDPNDTQKINDIIDSSIISNDRVVDDVTRKWEKWFKTASEEDKKKYLIEEDQQPGYSQQETKNAILRWMHDDPQARANAIGFMDYPPSKPKTTTSATPQGAITETNNNNKNFDIQQDVEAYGGIWGTLVNLGSKSFTSDPQTISEYVNLASGERKAVGVATRFEVVSYNPDKDLIIVKIKDSVPGKLREGQVVGLSGANYDKLLRSKPFFIDRTSLMKQYGTVQTTAPKKKLY
jgi:hypothetical protein